MISDTNEEASCSDRKMEIIQKTWTDILYKWLNKCVHPGKVCDSLSPACLTEIAKKYKQDISDNDVDTAILCTDDVEPFIKLKYPILRLRYLSDDGDYKKKQYIMTSVLLYHCCITSHSGIVHEDIWKNMNDYEQELILKFCERLDDMEITINNVDCAIKEAFDYVKDIQNISKDAMQPSTSYARDTIACETEKTPVITTSSDIPPERDQHKENKQSLKFNSSVTVLPSVITDTSSISTLAPEEEEEESTSSCDQYFNYTDSDEIHIYHSNEFFEGTNKKKPYHRDSPLTSSIYKKRSKSSKGHHKQVKIEVPIRYSEKISILQDVEIDNSVRNEAIGTEEHVEYIQTRVESPENRSLLRKCEEMYEKKRNEIAKMMQVDEDDELAAEIASKKHEESIKSKRSEALGSRASEWQELEPETTSKKREDSTKSQKSEELRSRASEWQELEPETTSKKHEESSKSKRSEALGSRASEWQELEPKTTSKKREECRKCKNREEIGMHCNELQELEPEFRSKKREECTKCKRREALGSHARERPELEPETTSKKREESVKSKRREESGRRVSELGELTEETISKKSEDSTKSKRREESGMSVSEKHEIAEEITSKNHEESVKSKTHEEIGMHVSELQELEPEFTSVEHEETTKSNKSEALGSRVTEWRELEPETKSKKSKGSSKSKRSEALGSRASELQELEPETTSKKIEDSTKSKKSEALGSRATEWQELEPKSTPKKCEERRKCKKREHEPESTSKRREECRKCKKREEIGMHLNDVQEVEPEFTSVEYEETTKSNRSEALESRATEWPEPEPETTSKKREESVKSKRREESGRRVSELGELTEETTSKKSEDSTKSKRREESGMSVSEKHEIAKEITSKNHEESVKSKTHEEIGMHVSELQELEPEFTSVEHEVTTKSNKSEALRSRATEWKELEPETKSNKSKGSSKSKRSEALGSRASEWQELEPETTSKKREGSTKSKSHEESGISVSEKHKLTEETASKKLEDGSLSKRHEESIISTEELRISTLVSPKEDQQSLSYAVSKHEKFSVKKHELTQEDIEKICEELAKAEPRRRTTHLDVISAESKHAVRRMDSTVLESSVKVHQLDGCSCSDCAFLPNADADDDDETDIEKICGPRPCSKNLKISRESRPYATSSRGPASSRVQAFSRNPASSQHRASSRYQASSRDTASSRDPASSRDAARSWEPEPSQDEEPSQEQPCRDPNCEYEFPKENVIEIVDRSGEKKQGCPKKCMPKSVQSLQCKAKETCLAKKFHILLGFGVLLLILCLATLIATVSKGGGGKSQIVINTNSKRYVRFVSTQTPYQQKHTWICKNRICQIVYYDSDNNTDPNIYSSLSRCTLLCMGPQLWPYPIGYTHFSNKLVALATNKLEYKFQSLPSEAVHQYLAEAFKLFISDLARLEKINENDAPKNYTEDLTVKKIFIQIDVEIDPEPRLKINTEESYHLKIDTVNNRIEVKISSASFCGVRHGLQTLSQMILLDQTSGKLITISSAVIKDAPTYRYRGLMIDTARNYIPVGDLLRTIDAMATVKMNTFHWRISDVASFPLYLPSIPMLFEYGAYNREMVYTKEDIKFLVERAGIRGVRVLIEIAAPGPVGRAWSWNPDANCPTANTENYTCDNILCLRLDLRDTVMNMLQTIYSEILEMTNVNDIFHISDGIYSLSNCYSLIENRKGFLKMALNHLKLANKGILPKLPIIWQTPHLHMEFEAKVWERFGVQLTEMPKDPADNMLAKFKVIHSTKWDLSCEIKKQRCTRYITWQEMYSWKSWRNIEVFTVEGGEAILWTDVVNSGNLDSHLWPRAAAVAERLWSDMVANSSVSGPVYVRLDSQRWRMVLNGVKVQPVWPLWCSLNPARCMEKVR